jgi:Dimethlysulfonioproprionate lyase
MTAASAANLRAFITQLTDELRARGGEGVDETLERLGQQDLSDGAFRRVSPQTKPVVRHLNETISDCAGLIPQLAQGIAALAPALHWVQSDSYTDEILGAGFSENYAWCEIIGAGGFFRGSDFNLGFLLLGPDRHYLDHYHPAPELYWPLTRGSLWKKGDGAFVERRRGEVIWHPSMVVHATITRDRPLLAAFGWTQHADIGARLCALDERLAKTERGGN